MTETTASFGMYAQVIYNPYRDDLAAILKSRPFDVLLDAVEVTESKIVLRFGPPLSHQSLVTLPPVIGVRDAG